jgi:anti-sigma B factor antagonist
MEGWTTSRFCSIPAGWSTSSPPWHGLISTGVSVMGNAMRAGAVRADDGPVFAVEVSSGVVRSRVILSGELDLASAPNLEQVLDQLCRDGYPEVVLDLSGLEFLSAAGLTVFLRAHDQLRDTGGRLILNRPGRLVRRVLAITELDTVLIIREETAFGLDHASPEGMERCPHQQTPAPTDTRTNRHRGPRTSVLPVLMSLPIT